MARRANAQYNLASPDSLAVWVANSARFKMYDRFVEEFRPTPSDKVLDIGVTSDRSYASSNYFEAMYPYKEQVTATGIDDASYLEELYPGMTFMMADALELPFADRSFDYVHSSAVLEHVGSFDNQRRMIHECSRVARKGLFLTTPNRWFPIEFHTQLPLLHWLPKSVFRSVLNRLGQVELAKEENLNLMSPAELHAATEGQANWRYRVKTARLLGMSSNLLLVASPLENW